jgi:uncharacterized protein (TIGR02145 family)
MRIKILLLIFGIAVILAYIIYLICRNDLASIIVLLGIFSIELCMYAYMIDKSSMGNLAGAAIGIVTLIGTLMPVISMKLDFEMIIKYVNEKDTLTYEKGVVINGVKWATRNVGEKGKFVYSQEQHGIDYTLWDAQNACPVGWRLPTRNEINLLLDKEKVSNKWIIQSGINGYLFTDKITGATLFLPAAGGHDGNTGTLDHKGNAGYYWSSTPHNSDCTYYLRLFSNDIGCHFFYNSNGFSIRPVIK